MGGDKWMYVLAALPLLVMSGPVRVHPFFYRDGRSVKQPKKELSNKSKRIHEARVQKDINTKKLKHK